MPKFVHIVPLAYPVGEDSTTHYYKFYDAARWCDKNIGTTKWEPNMRSGKMPFQFHFKRPKDALRFKLTWGI